MGDDMVSLGFVVGLDYRDVELSVHDLLQELKTHPLVREDPRRAASASPGARRRSPRAGCHALPRRFDAPGLLLVGEGAGLVNVPRLKGVHYAIESGRLAAEAAFRALQRGETPGRVGALDAYDDVAARELSSGRSLHEVRNMRQAFDKGFFVGGALASAMTVTKGKLPPNGASTTEPNAAAPLLRTGPRVALSGAGREAHVRQALVGLRLRQPDARRPAEPHPRSSGRCRATSPRCGRGCARRRCTRSARTTATARSSVEVTPSNCVQCGAITAKGGRLTPPEGGSGPEYTLT